jgi:hypothetical protein
VIGLGTAAFNRSREKPSSSGASVTISESPSSVNNWTLSVSGGGWGGDNSVTVTYESFTGLGETPHEIQLSDGGFTFSRMLLRAQPRTMTSQ